MTRQSFSPNALAWVPERVDHVGVHRVANGHQVADRTHRAVMACGWRPSKPGQLLTAHAARTVLRGLFCVGCWRRP